MATMKAELLPYGAPPEITTFTFSPRVARIMSVLVVGLAMLASTVGMRWPTVYGDKLWEGAFGNDLVTLALGVPILTASLIFSIRGSFRATLLWFGSLYYMLYNFAFYLFGVPVSRLFPVFIGLFTFSAFALVFGVANLNLDQAGRQFTAKTPARTIAVWMFFLGLMIVRVWMVPWLKFALYGVSPRVYDSENAYRVIATVDLVFMVSLLFPTAYWLWKRRPLGFVLAAMMNVQGALYTTVLAVCCLFSWKAGVPDALSMLPNWIFGTVASLLCLTGLLWHIEKPKLLPLAP
jgi:hypothetical protein